MVSANLKFIGPGNIHDEQPAREMPCSKNKAFLYPFEYILKDTTFVPVSSLN
jgi:hypothetical protein